MRRRFRSAPALPALLLLAACNAGLQRPEIELESVSLGSLGLRGGTLLVNVRVENPNRFELRANSVDYALHIRDTDEDAAADSAWVEFARGTYDERITIGARETRVVSIPVEFTFSGLGGAAGELLRMGRFNYRATGTADVSTPFGSRAVPFRKTGIFTMSGATR
ncbi:MAG TPA: LEA type 2 family protein [Longimicrobiaceae bacterium]|nr:LEA type 2 family protein [Longimicrobiaceae bacterium]